MREQAGQSQQAQIMTRLRHLITQLCCQKPAVSSACNAASLSGSDLKRTFLAAARVPQIQEQPIIPQLCFSQRRGYKLLIRLAPNQNNACVNALYQMEKSVLRQKFVKVNGEQSVRSYCIGSKLGSGSFGEVYQVTTESMSSQAVKVVNKAKLVRSKQRSKFIGEIKIHKSLLHENVVRFNHVFEDKTNIYILLELCRHGSLKSMVAERGGLSLPEIVYFLRQLVAGVGYIHRNAIIHRDLKVGNLFLSAGLTLKIGDFGLCSKLLFEGEKKRTVCGTPNYIAPEVVESSLGHSYPADIWAVGVIAYVLAFGKPPFQSITLVETYRKITECQYFMPKATELLAVKDFISQILLADPEKRPSIEQLADHYLFSSVRVPVWLPDSALRQQPTLGPECFKLRRERTSLAKYKIDDSKSERLLQSAISNSFSQSRKQKPNALSRQQSCKHFKPQFKPEQLTAPRESATATSPAAKEVLVFFKQYSEKRFYYITSSGDYGLYESGGLRLVYRPSTATLQIQEEKARLVKLSEAGPQLSKRVNQLCEMCQSAPRDRRRTVTSGLVAAAKVLRCNLGLVALLTNGMVQLFLGTGAVWSGKRLGVSLGGEQWLTAEQAQLKAKTQAGLKQFIEIVAKLSK